MRRLTAWAVLLLLSVVVTLGSALGSHTGEPEALTNLGVVAGVALMWVLVVVFMMFSDWLDGPAPVATNEPRRRP
jgi:hypothetical protein